MASKWKIRLSGSGGQGVIKGAMFLAQAALFDGSNATQSQVYGPESRGGSTRAEVNISDSRILYPKVVTPNVVLALTPEAYQKFGKDVEAGGTVILDGDLDGGAGNPNATTYRIPITVIAREKAGNELCTNTVALGVLVGITGMVSEDSLIAAIEDGFGDKPKVAELNVRAFKLGVDAAKEAMAAAK